MTTWLLFDVNYLGYRAFYSTGQLSHEGNPTGVIFGVLSEALRCIEQFNTLQCCWCFDLGRPKRLDLLPDYKATRKAKRKEMTPEQREAHRGMKMQIGSLRELILPGLGFRNVFAEPGYEADDVIASLVHSIPKPHTSIIVSADEDLFQLLSPRCSIWNPNKKKMTTEKSFSKEYGITPSQWIDVKSLAGCSSDDIPGVEGVGEKTAIKYITGRLPPGKALDKIVLNKRWKRNFKIVTLPFEDCPDFQRKKDKLTREKWEHVMDDLGFDSLMRSFPAPPASVSSSHPQYTNKECPTCNGSKKNCPACKERIAEYYGYKVK